MNKTARICRQGRPARRLICIKLGRNLKPRLFRVSLQDDFFPVFVYVFEIVFKKRQEQNDVCRDVQREMRFVVLPQPIVDTYGFFQVSFQLVTERHSYYNEQNSRVIRCYCRPFFPCFKSVLHAFILY